MFDVLPLTMGRQGIERQEEGFGGGLNSSPAFTLITHLPSQVLSSVLLFCFCGKFYGLEAGLTVSSAPVGTLGLAT